MNCKRCGAELWDTAKVCDVCGAPVDMPQSSLMDFYEEVDADEGDIEVYFVPSDAKKSQSRRTSRGSGRSGRKAFVLLLSVAVVIACIGIVAYVFVVRRNADSANGQAVMRPESIEQNDSSRGEGAEDDSLSQSDANKKVVIIPLEVEGDGLDEAGSRIPVLVTGTRADGRRIENTEYVNHDGSGLAMSPGFYTLYIAGSPISANGILYGYSDGSLSIAVSEDNDLGVYLEGGPLILTSKAEDDVTEEDIERSRELVSKDSQKADLADSLAKSARSRYLHEEANR